MPRNTRRDRMIDRLMSRRDGRNPYGSRGGYVTSGRSRRDRGEDYASNRGYRIEQHYDGAGDYADMRSNRGRDYADYESGDMAGRGRSRDRARDYRDYEDGDMARGGRGRDGHYPQGMSSYYQPIEAMGYFNGYYGMNEPDYARGGSRGGRGRDRGEDYADYDYGDDMAGDYGETLSKEELEKWNKKLMKNMEEQDKQMFDKENIKQKAKQMGIQMKGFNEEELITTATMLYSDYGKTIKKFVGSNMDIYIAMARDFLQDKDAAVKGGEKLAVYYDCIVESEEE